VAEHSIASPSDKSQTITPPFDSVTATGGKHAAFVAATGVFVMNPDGAGLQRLMELWAGGTIDWLP